jgi:HD-like signal output (HDOD) protein/DNA-binding response OmpR family regulator
VSTNLGLSTTGSFCVRIGGFEMALERHRALIVDDEEQVRNLVARALGKEGFECDVVVDGYHALRIAATSRYDVVVTDLKMPNKNGHALALEMLQQESRPLIVVHTGVVEPRLTKDLLIRGVDDILFKPIDYAFLAAKVKGMVERRPRSTNGANNIVQHSQDAATQGPLHEDSKDAPLSLSKLNAKLAELSTVLPVSNSAVDVYEMTRSDNWELSQIAAAIQRDASLATEVLRLSNSSFYNRSESRIVSLDQAVLRIGQNRVGELALAANALAALTPTILPWMDLELVWKRSMAAGIAIESLVELGGHQKIEEGLLLSAIMFPLGRIALGMMFPKHYESMVETCNQTGEALREQERRLFPTSHTMIMAQLLASWRIAPDVFVPLKFALDDFSALSRFAEPTRTRTELVKVAIMLGRLALDRWENWDLVQFPTSRVLKRLRIRDVGKIVQQTRSDLSKLADFHPGGVATNQQTTKSSVERAVAYCNPSENEVDLLIELLPSMGLQPKACTIDELRNSKEASIVNGLGMASARFAGDGDWNSTLFITDHEHGEIAEQFPHTAALPNSYGRFRDALLNHVTAHAAE